MQTRTKGWLVCAALTISSMALADDKKATTSDDKKKVQQATPDAFKDAEAKQAASLESAEKQANRRAEAVLQRSGLKKDDAKKALGSFGYDSERKSTDPTVSLRNVAAVLSALDERKELTTLREMLQRSSDNAALEPARTAAIAAIQTEASAAAGKAEQTLRAAPGKSAAAASLTTLTTKLALKQQSETNNAKALLEQGKLAGTLHAMVAALSGGVRADQLEGAAQAGSQAGLKATMRVLEQADASQLHHVTEDLLSNLMAAAASAGASAGLLAAQGQVNANAIANTGCSTGCAFQIRLATHPPTRTVCTLESESGRFSATAEWDPLHVHALSKLILWPYAEDAKRVSCVSDAQRNVLTEAEYNWTFISTQAPSNPADIADLLFTSRSKDNVPSATTTGTLRLYEPSDDASALLVQAPTRTEISALKSERSLFGLSEQAATEMLQIVADVLISKAQRKALYAARLQLEAHLKCAEDNTIFTATCASLKKLRFDDLIADGESLLRVLAEDVTYRLLYNALPLDAANTPSEDDAFVRDVARVLASRFGSKPENLLELAQRAAVWSAARLPNAEIRKLAALCIGAENCSEAMLSTMLAKPGKFGGTLPAKLTISETAWIRAAVHVMRPTRDFDDDEVAAATIEMLLALAEVKGTITHQGAETLRRALHAAAHRDLPLLIATGASVLSGYLKTEGVANNLLGRVSSVIGTYVSTYRGSLSSGAEDAKARREAKKAAVEAFLSEQSRRDIIAPAHKISFGSSVGLTAGMTTRTEAKFAMAPMATAGVAYSFHGTDNWGAHVELAPIDLGGYAQFRVDPDPCDDSNEAGCSGGHSTRGPGFATPTPLSFLKPTLNVGALYHDRRSDSIFWFGLTASYLSEFKTSDTKYGNDSLYFGLATSVYFPWFDFN